MVMARTAPHMRDNVRKRKHELTIIHIPPIPPSFQSLVEIFGMTETTGAATVQPFNFKCAGRIGKPGIGVECKIAEDGELLVKSGIIFKGYYKNPEATANTIQDGWLHTGDIATAFEDGSYSIVDRKKDIIINAAGNYTRTKNGKKYCQVSEEI